MKRKSKKQNLIQVSFLQHDKRQNVICHYMYVYDGMIQVTLENRSNKLAEIAMITNAVILEAFATDAIRPDDLYQLKFDGIEFIEYTEYEASKQETLSKGNRS